jgi:SAM-dependent methyltransferase
LDASNDPLRMLEYGEFLRAWHARYPGKTGTAFGYGRVEGDGRSSYALLVDDVADLSNAQTVIDLACGDGFLLARLAERFPEAQIIGVDMTPEELELARARGLPRNVRFLAARAEALPFADRSADAIVCHMALMLFDDAREVIAEVSRVLRPGGIFAAVLGPGQGNSDLVNRVVALLREAETAEKLPPLRAGDPMTFERETLLELFTTEAWQTVRADDIRLCFEGTDERIETTLLSMYNVARLSDRAQAELAQWLATELLERRKTGKPTECAVGLRHLIALKS